MYTGLSISTVFQSLVFCLPLILTGCSENSIETVQQEGELVVLTRNAPSSWYEGRDGPRGPEYDLVRAFARYYKLKVRFEIKQNLQDIIESVHANRAHIAAAGITRTELREENGYIFGPGYQQVQQILVCRRGNVNIPRETAEMAGIRLAVINSSSYLETLKELQQDVPGLSWEIAHNADTEQLLKRVWEKETDCTISDSNIFSINRRYYPELVVALPLGEEQSLAWLLSPEYTGLHVDIEEWLEYMRESGELASIMEHYYGHIDSYDYVDISRFKRRIRQRLPKYKKQFIKAARKHKLPWTLLAAQAYQESHWNPKSRSPTGVRGLMMLTLRTAKALGIKNRLDPKQSIKGGARYLSRMYRRIPGQVIEQDRLWYALAAYNIGYGHLMDARLLAERMGKDPNRWVTLKEVLPLLAEKKHYRTLPHGYARGSEPVRYVQRIREYQQVLLQQLTDQLAYGF